MQKADTDTEIKTHTEDTDAIPERETPPMTPRGRKGNYELSIKAE